VFQVLREVFIDIPQALTLLGEMACAFLNDKVKHEAVEYLQECAYTNVPCISFAATGEGAPQELLLDPPSLPYGGLLSIGAPYRGAVTLHNPTPAMAEVTIATDRLLIKSLTSSIPLSSAELAKVRTQRTHSLTHKNAL
jgi:hypothetical protein